MKTITFYSFKGGTGRSLALANAACYLARLEFKVVALDFDLEAPGLHYKFSQDKEGKPIPVQVGILDYLYRFMVESQLSTSLKEYLIDVPVPGSNKQLVQLIPAGQVPSREYCLRLSQINWHRLFYEKDALGVEVFLDLKNRIMEELNPDFLLIDSRTGITEMGGVATTLLADMVVCLVLPNLENLEGARAVLRSLRTSRREIGAEQVEILVALSRLPESKAPDSERKLVDRIRTVLNEEADDLRDTLSCSEVYVLHSEPALAVHESLRIGSGMRLDDSVLLRDYLRLFANIVSPDIIKTKIHELIRLAKERIWDDPDGATKEIEELAESFGHPEIYRELLRFYEVRNVTGPSVLKRTQRLWELTRNPNESTVWQSLKRAFPKPVPSWQARPDSESSVDLDFVEEVWRGAGKMDPEFGMKIVDTYEYKEEYSRAADILRQVFFDAPRPRPELASRCISLLMRAERFLEAKTLIGQVKPQLFEEPEFVDAWAKYAIQNDDKEAFAELIKPPIIEVLKAVSPASAAEMFMRFNLRDEANVMADRLVEEINPRRIDHRALLEIARLFHNLNRYEDFERKMDVVVDPQTLQDIKERLASRRRLR